ncbi:putative serine/threonine-protein kinase-like protein CCR3 [Vigna angularis]|uniref:putative serine/threonine-protein kinase-like protein CCR3 n=1 Tax=Phaseolus angularis TaxID=3914 RepID=UPI0022B2CC2A|nr:putative serine/threonine-protein kinase-like protein CCR3 [Vigna angularis]
MARYMGDATSFWSAVDSPIRSETASNFGASPPHSFASVVDYALRSSCASEADFRTSRVSSFASGVDYVIRSSSSSTGGTDLETFPVPGFTSEVHSTTVAEGSSPVLSNVTEHAVKGLQLFSQAELVAATNNFSLNNKIGAGRLGVVYIGKLVDGREVAIKRVETWQKKKTSSIKSALTFLSRLHHKHLVGLVGFCEEKYERLLVYEYMKNGTLYDHLHENGSNVLNRWKMRITIALDASRGIEYLHNYAVPLFIHGDVKSSNILLDATWMARVSDFKFSLMSPEAECDYRRIKLGGTVGYIDPEYYDLNMLTAKSDVYGLGVVLLELLTGKRAIFLDGEDGGTLSVHRLVDFAVPAILAGELVNILDPRVGPPDVNEIEALELVAKTALHCVNRKGKDRPSMADIVICLERALAICYGRSYRIIMGGWLLKNIVWKYKGYVRDL